MVGKLSTYKARCYYTNNTTTNNNNNNNSAALVKYTQVEKKNDKNTSIYAARLGVVTESSHTEQHAERAEKRRQDDSVCLCVCVYLHMRRCMSSGPFFKNLFIYFLYVCMTFAAAHNMKKH